MTPDMVNFSGKVHGGALLELLDEVAYNCAARYSHVMPCFFVMVAMDEDGRPCEVPKFEPRTDDDRRRWNDAQLRRADQKNSQERQRELASDPTEFSVVVST